jgi:hypothetical protein
MSIYIVYPDGTEEVRRTPITFEQIQKLVGGYVEVVTVRDDDGEVIQGCCNEDGRAMGQPHNPKATARFRSKILGDCVGVWVLLKGKDMLR